MRMRANDAHASSQLPERCLHRACASQDADAARTEKEPGHHLCARMCVSMLACPIQKIPETGASRGARGHFAVLPDCGDKWVTLHTSAEGEDAKGEGA